MRKLYYFSIYLQYFVSFCKDVNHYLVAAEPLIGKKVTRANDGEFPSVVSLGRAPGDKLKHHFCTGTLITKRHVLTAAHCVEITPKSKSYLKPGGFVVTVGSTDVTQGTKYDVKEWIDFGAWLAKNRITLDRFHGVFYHDIAIVTLTNNVAEDIKPANPSPLNYEFVRNKNLVTAGWGITNSNERTQYLLRADLKVIDRKTCLQNLIATNETEALIVIEFCTIARPPVSLGCGDSGGPIFVNGDEIIGVNIGDCIDDHEHPNQQNLHAPVKLYMQFICAILDTDLDSNSIESHCGKRAKTEYILNGFYSENC